MTVNLKEIIAFGVVGSLGTLANLVGVWALVEFLHWPPLLANVLAFLCAFPISLFGHRLWTFKKQAHPPSFGYRFFTVAILGFFLGESLFAVTLKVLHLPYLLGLCIVLLFVAGTTFVLSKFWAFSTGSKTP